MRTTYRSKVSIGTKTLFLLLGVTCLMGAFFVGVWYIWLVALIVIAMLTDVYYQTYYKIDANQNTLHIKGGVLVSKKIPLKSIRKIEESQSAVSGPALSNQRLEIHYNTFDSILISPEHPIDFIKQLQESNPLIVFIPKNK